VTALLALAGCHASRVAALEERVTARRAEVQALTEQVADLRRVLDARPPPTASIRKDNDPPAFDYDKPLPPGDPRRPDVIVLSIDTLRADHLGTYGYHRDTSPFLDQLGREGTVYEQMWSATSWTLPSHTTMLSGWLPVHHGAIDDHLRIAPDVTLLQEAFEASGYRTIGVVSTLFVSSRFGFDRGFDRFEDFGIKSKRENNLSTVDADHVFHNAYYWAQKQPQNEPMFVFVHVYDAHYQYDPPAPWNEKYDRKPQWGDAVYRNYQAYQKNMIPKVQLDHQVAQYDEEIAFVDDSFREFVTRWRSAGRDAIVVVTADHGEEFGERGSWGHAHTLYPEQLHVPLIVNGPGVKAQRVTTRMGTEDLAPTVAALVGVPFGTARDGVNRAAEVRSGAPWTGRTSAPFGDTSRFDTLVYRWHEPPYDLVVDIGHYRRELYDLSADPEARTNVYKGNKELADQMFARMSAWLGEPWTATADGMVEVRNGVVFAEGGDRKGETWAVKKGATFSVQPGDAQVVFHGTGTAGTLGPWRPLGGMIPGARCPVAFDGRYVENAEIAALSAEETQMLVALGYQADEGEDAAASPGGPAPCE
jgi:arylsulfatase A-like enzyme